VDGREAAEVPLRLVAVSAVSPVVWLKLPLLAVVAAVSFVKFPPPDDVELLPVAADPCVSVFVPDDVDPVAENSVGVSVCVGGILLSVSPMPVIPEVLCVDEVAVTELVGVLVPVGSSADVFPVPVVVFVVVVVPTLLSVELDISVDDDVNLRQNILTLIDIAANIVFWENGKSCIARDC